MNREPAGVIQDVARCVEQAVSGIRAYPSPQEIYEHKLADIKKQIAETWRTLSSSPEAAHKGLQDKIIFHGGELKVLQLTYERTRESDEGTYKRQHEEILKQLCNSIATVLGPLGFQISQEHISTNVAHKGTQILHRPHSAVKRPLTAAEIQRGGSAPRKRQRTDRRFISYTQVLQESKASTPHIIVEFPENSDQWYILRCEEHAMEFRNHPIMGAAAHLGSGKHGHKSRKHAVVIKLLGIEVLDCDKTLAERNNSIARQRYHEDVEDEKNSRAQRQPQASRALYRQTRQGFHTRTRDLHDSETTTKRSGSIEPIAGNVYLGYWEKSREWIPVLLLPTSDLDTVGVSGTLQQLGLADDVPKCYNYNEETQSFSWQQGYEDGGHLAPEREFPVMYFDGLPFPAESAVGWLAARNLKTLNLDEPKTLIPRLGLVKKFLTKREMPLEDQNQGDTSCESTALYIGLTERQRTSNPGPSHATTSTAETRAKNNADQARLLQKAVGSLESDLLLSPQAINGALTSDVGQSVSIQSITNIGESNPALPSRQEERTDMPSTAQARLESIAGGCLSLMTVQQSKPFKNDRAQSRIADAPLSFRVGPCVSTQTPHRPISPGLPRDNLNRLHLEPSLSSERCRLKPISLPVSTSSISNTEKLPSVRAILKETSGDVTDTKAQVYHGVNPMENLRGLPEKAVDLLKANWNRNEFAPGDRAFRNAGHFICPLCLRCYVKLEKFGDHIMQKHADCP